MPRPTLEQLTPAEVAPLERLIDRYPEAWQQLAHSFYCTLLGRAGWPFKGHEAGGQGRMQYTPTDIAEMAGLAALLAMGVGEDLGGVQLYVPVGAGFVASDRAMRVVAAWRRGQPFAQIVRNEKITERRVRQIIRAWQQESFARQQGSLALDGNASKKN